MSQGQDRVVRIGEPPAVAADHAAFDRRMRFLAFRAMLIGVTLGALCFGSGVLAMMFRGGG